MTRWFSKFNTTFVAITLIGVTLGNASCYRDIPHRSDGEMIAHFRDKQRRFECLLEMVRHDERLVGERFFRIDRDWTEPKDLEQYGITASRVSEYRRMFRELGVPRGFAAYGKGDYYTFIASSTGLAVSGSSKEFVWAEEPPKLLVDDDIQEYVLNNETSRAYRQIDGHWYLAFITD